MDPQVKLALFTKCVGVLGSKIELRKALECVLKGQEMPVGIEDGRLKVIYAAAARMSVKEKRTVKVSEIVADPKARY